MLIGLKARQYPFGLDSLLRRSLPLVFCALLVETHTMKPEFVPGKNIAVKTPSHEYETVVGFYKNVLGFKQIPIENADHYESVAFEFGDKVLWVDRIEGISQSEIWLEILSKDIAASQEYLVAQGCKLRNDIEELPNSIEGFWLSSPSNIIHLVVNE